MVNIIQGKLNYQDIPIFGRIITIADVSNALTTKRPYKKARPNKDALELIEREKEHHFNPKLVDAFLRR